MSSNTRPPEPGHPALRRLARPRPATLLRIALVLSYPLLAHLASGRHDGRSPLPAPPDLALGEALRPLLQGRWKAWATVAAIALALAWLARTGHAPELLLLVPVLIIGLVAWGFGRTLRTVPLIPRLVAGLDGIAASKLSP